MIKVLPRKNAANAAQPFPPGTKKPNLIGPKNPQPSGPDYFYYTVRRKGVIVPSACIAVTDPEDPFMVNFLKHNQDFEKVKITVSPT
jgi:hypothetical protein